jgi:PEP-CTERM motif
MESKFGVSVVGSLALLCLFMLAPSAHADQFQVTGQTNVPICTELDTHCATVSFTLNLQTQLATNIPYGNVYDVTSMSGVLDGLYDITGSGGWLLPVSGNSQSPLPYGPISYTFDGQQGQISFDDLIAGSSFMSLLPSFGGQPGGSAYITWNIVDPVSAPEPSTLLLLGVGLSALFLVKRFVA